MAIVLIWTNTEEERCIDEAIGGSDGQADACLIGRNFHEAGHPHAATVADRYDLPDPARIARSQVVSQELTDESAQFFGESKDRFGMWQRRRRNLA